MQHFAFRWGVADALVTSATTGVAATLLNGMTFYKALNVDMNVLKRTVTAADIVAWQPVGVLIIDEISFVGRKKLARLEQRLRRLKNNQVLFGGVHVILAGDLYQLKGQEKAVYASPEQDEKKTLSDQGSSMD